MKYILRRKHKDFINNPGDFDHTKNAAKNVIIPDLMHFNGKSGETTICALISNSFELGKFPENWRNVSICPIYNSGDKSEITSCRPISLLSLAGNVTEHCIF